MGFLAALAIVDLLATAPPLQGFDPTADPTLIPLVVDWRKVPPGAWAEYKMTFPVPVTTRILLLRRRGQQVTIQYTASIFGVLIRHLTYDLAKGVSGRPQKEVVQRPPHAPMREKHPRGFYFFAPPVAAELVGSEEVTVDSKKVLARHYRRGSAAAAYDYWVSDSIAPVGIVRIAGPLYGYELVRWGHGPAKSDLRGKVRPFDKQGMLDMFTVGPDVKRPQMIPAPTHPAAPAK